MSLAAEEYANCKVAKDVIKSLTTQVFHEIPGRNALTYTAIIGGLALHGDARNALLCFRQMIDAGLVPDKVTFLGVLSACCHGGLVKEGRKIFSEMSSKFKVPPKIKHYSYMVELVFWRKMMCERGVDKIPGCSSIEVNGNRFKIVQK